MNERDPADKGLISAPFPNRDTATTGSDPIRVFAPETQVEWFPKGLQLWTNSDIWPCQIGDFLICLHNRAKKYILQHATETIRREVGGVLIGGAYSTRDSKYIEITAAIRGEFTRGNAARLTFTADTWADITRIVERDYKDQRVVGWYHTHPNWGIFLSDLDLDIQNNFFDQPDQVALVIDPIRKEGGFFHGTQKNSDGVQKSELFTWDHSLYFPPAFIQDDAPGTRYRQTPDKGLGIFENLRDSWSWILKRLGGSRLNPTPSSLDITPMLRLTSTDIPQEVKPLSKESQVFRPVRPRMAWGFWVLAFLLGGAFFVISSWDFIIVTWDSVLREFPILRRILLYPMELLCFIALLVVIVGLVWWAFWAPIDDVGRNKVR